MSTFSTLRSVGLAAALVYMAGCVSPVERPHDQSSMQTTNQDSSNTSWIAKLVKDVDEVATAGLVKDKLPGLAVVVVKDGETIFSKAYGYADFESRIPVDPDDTLFRIGSITKPLTALGIVALVEQGRLSLEDEVTDYTADLPAPLDASGSHEPVRIWNLLTHTGGYDQIGVGRYDPDFTKDIDQRRRERPTLGEFLAQDNLRRTIPPGTLYRYDTYGITLAGYIIEQITGLTYEQAMQELLFEPAGMTKTSVGVAPSTRSKLARGHGWVNGDLALAGYELYFTQPASSIDATPADMSRLLEALTGSGVTSEGKRLFAEETIDAIFSVQYRPHPDFPGMTHGFVDEGGYSTLDGYLPREVGHSGSMFGFRSSLTVFPEHSVALFVSTNRNYETGGGRVNVNGEIFRLLRSYLADVPSEVRHAVPKESSRSDFTEYAGEYFYDVFCSTCSFFAAHVRRKNSKVEHGLKVTLWK